MACYLNLFSPETYEAFSKEDAESKLDALLRGVW